MSDTIMNAHEKCLVARVILFLRKYGLDKVGEQLYAVSHGGDETEKLIGLVLESPLLVDDSARAGKLKAEPMR